MRVKNIVEPGVGIAAQPYFYGGDLKNPAGYDLWFILWDQAEKSTDWFYDNRQDIVRYLENLEEYPDDVEALDLHYNEPRLQKLDAINFDKLAEEGEVCMCQDLGMDEFSYSFHLLFVRRDGNEYVLSGGHYGVYIDFALKSEWNWDEELPSKLSDVSEEDREDFFEVRVPADKFEAEYNAAVEQYHREKLHERSYTPDSNSFRKQLQGVFKR